MAKAEAFTRSERLRSLSELLAERRDWPLKDRLTFVQELARRVWTLHQNGRIHRAIGIDEVGVDEQLRPRLSPPGAPRRFGGEDDCDPEFCPPELTERDAVELPAEIDTAAKALQEAGYALDPRRIDVYQLGALLCRLATGGPVLPYIYDATVKARVPAVVRPLLERTLGLESSERWENCERLIEGLDEALRRAELLKTPTSTIDTPAHGSGIVPDDDTPPQGTQQPAPEIVEPLPFTQLGHYRIVEQIGAGGMGDVYRGYDESLERPVAIKVLPSQLARDADFVRRFHAEATAAAGVAHPNVVPIYFIGEDAGHHFFAMQCIEGESLAERLDRQGQLPVDEALELIGQCLAGLQAAHERGLIHRDIKPGNILLERGSGRAMLVDFGLVRRTGQSAQMTATGVIMGTVDYIAPEQARGKSIDGRADLYSLGVLFYQLLSGRMPFTADSPTAMIFQHAYEEPFPLEEAVPGLPPPVARIVERMMAKEPDHRYPDCEAVLADVRAYRQGQPLASDESALAGGFEEESSPGGELKLPEGLARLLEPGRLQGARDWAATLFRRHAPEYVQQMQGTTQQVDAAVAHYQRRRNRLAKLLEEARAIEADLSRQIESNQSASAAALASAESADDEERKQAALAKQCECEEQVAALRSQHELQQQAASDLERQLGKADATLARLCSQQEVMKARLQAAVAQQRLEAGQPRPKARRWLLPAAIGGASLLAVALLLLVLPRPNIPTEPSVASKPAPAAEQPPKPNPKVPPGAALLMTFDKNTLLEVTGIIFRIRSLTGRNNGKDITAQYAPDGKVGGAVSIEDGSEVRIPGHIVNRRPEYTVTAWVKRKDKEHLWVYNENADGTIFNVDAQTNGAVAVRSYHKERSGSGTGDATPEGLVPPNQWTFVAARLVRGDRLNKGERSIIRVNDRSYACNLLPVYHDSTQYSSIGAGNGSWEDRTHGRGTGLVDELTVYPRALSDAEIETLYQMGLHGESLGDSAPIAASVIAPAKPPLGPTKSPGPLVPRLNPKLPPDPVLLMTFEKNTLEERFGTIEAVQNLTGSYGHGEGRGAIWSPNGKVGGAFACDSGFIKIPRDLRNWESEYTFFAWINPPKDVQFRVFSDYDGGILAKIAVAKEGNVFATASHIYRKNGKFFVPTPSTPLGVVPPNQWTFIALTLTDGDVNKGKLRITVNDKSYDTKLQKIQGNGTGERSCHLGHGNDPCKGMIDEVGFYDRALSDAEINTIYQMGLDGENLAEMVPDVPAGANLWDFSEGTMVTSCSGTKSDIRNMFGGAFGNSVMLFSDGLPAGTVHFVEWKTPTPITLRSFSLMACHDGLAAGALLRGFSCFRLFAEDPDTGKFDVKLHEISPTNPYGDTPEPPYTHLDRSRGFQHLALMANIPATTAQRFRAEFVQFGPANKTVSGPRIIELKGFDTYYPDRSIPENQKPGAAKAKVGSKTVS